MKNKNTDDLIHLIKSKGLKMKYIASELGIGITTLWRKLRGMSDFRQSEIVKLCALLGITSASERDRLFLR